jgi:hypothetical protein
MESQLGKAFERLPIVGRSRWIAGAIDDNRFGAWGDELFQFMGVNGVPVLFTGWQNTGVASFSMVWSA